ncbi:MAG TPA: alanine dehydrogenase [Gammaproteobacteria bacterium]|nr:alanine dehydrogenase [Gammaproteobacteria bacterium]
MRIGVPTEIKANEYRVGLTPGSVRELHAHGHAVLVQRGAGAGIGAADERYREAGATLVDTAAEVFAGADLIVKVKEPQPVELAMLEARHVLFTYLHLAADAALARGLAAIGCTGIAYETVGADDGSLPLLAPMSEVAGRLSIQAGARCLEHDVGGAGLLLGGVPGVAAAEVLILGGGVVGANAVQMALGVQARVTVIDKSLPRLRALEAQFGGQLNTVHATQESIGHYLRQADLVIGAVLVPGAAAPKLVTRAMLATMKPGSAIVDVAIDQGGCVETSRPTTHANPTFIVDGVVHYCVTNMPGVVPRTSAYALNNATLPFVLQLADHGPRAALAADPHLRQGLNVYAGQITHPGVAEAIGAPCVSVDFSCAA